MITHLVLGLADWWWLLLPVIGAFGHGKDCVIKLDDSAGSLTTITSYLDQADLEQILELAETTVFGATSKAFIPGLRDNKLSASGIWDPTLDALLNGDLGVTASTSLEVHPQGTASGKIKYSVECWVTNVKCSLPLSDAGKISFDAQCTGNITRGTN